MIPDMAKLMISHRAVDNAEAERLANDLKQAGHDVWLDLWDIKIGDSIVDKMDQALGQAQYVIFCLSASGVHSPWIGREWMSTLARQLESKGVKLLPVKLTGGDLPPIVADFKYADAVKDYVGALAELLHAIK